MRGVHGVIGCINGSGTIHCDGREMFMRKLHLGFLFPFEKGVANFHARVHPGVRIRNVFSMISVISVVKHILSWSPLFV